MLETLQSAPRGDIVLLHGCCHNPTGMDLDTEQWREVARVVCERELIPFIDIAYQGLANGIDEDAFAPRLFVGRVPELIVSASCSKNFGLYRDRVGSLSLLSDSAGTATKVRTQAMNIVRTMYSMPPDHGAAVVRLILANDGLRAEWSAEVDAVRQRLKAMRRLLTAALLERAPDHDFSHIERANGMFSFLGSSAAQVEQLKKDYGVYMVDSSRINVAGITRGNVEYLAESIAAVL
jgi:aspartate/tyrosine/aromatic aminotransferase